MPQEWQAFSTLVVQPQTSPGSMWTLGFFHPAPFGWFFLQIWVVPYVHVLSRTQERPSAELWSSPCVLLSLLCPVGSSHTASLNSKFCLLSSGRQLGSSSLFWPEYFLQASASWGNLRTASSVSPLSGITVLCSQIANVWNQVFKIHLVLYFSYCTQEGESGPCYSTVVRSSGPYPNFYSDHFLKLLCGFITHMYISRDYRLVLPIKNYYTSFKSVLIYRILLHPFLSFHVICGRTGLFDLWFLMLWILLVNICGSVPSHMALVFCVSCHGVAPELWSDLGSISLVRLQGFCPLQPGGTQCRWTLFLWC